LFLHPPIESLPALPQIIRRHGSRQRKRVYNDGRVGALRRWLLNTFGRVYLTNGSGIIDVAGGKGEFSFEMCNLNDIKSTVFDPRPMELRRFIRKLEFGYYHRNSVLNSYNDKSKNSPVIMPHHIRGFFQLCNSYEICSFNSLKGEDINIPKMLIDEETFNNCLQFSLNTFWSTKGLQHDDDVDHNYVDNDDFNSKENDNYYNDNAAAAADMENKKVIKERDNFIDIDDNHHDLLSHGDKINPAMPHTSVDDAEDTSAINQGM